MKDLMGMMKAAQEMKGRMEDFQNQLESLRVEGRSGGGLVTVTLSGKGELKGVKIDPSLFKEDDVEILEDLIVAAHKDAKDKAEGDAITGHPTHFPQPHTGNQQPLSPWRVPGVDHRNIVGQQTVGQHLHAHTLPRQPGEQGHAIGGRHEIGGNQQQAAAHGPQLGQQARHEQPRFRGGTGNFLRRVAQHVHGGPGEITGLVEQGMGGRAVGGGKPAGTLWAVEPHHG